MQINFIPPVNNLPFFHGKTASHTCNSNDLQCDTFCKTVKDNKKSNIKVIKNSFGVTKTGEPVYLYTLVNKKGDKVSLSNFGATIVSVEVESNTGEKVNVLQGYKSVKDYDGTPNGHAGGTIGPCANKIGEGKFTLNGQEYHLETNKDNGKTHCHGASAGFDIKNWKSEIIDNGVRFTLERPDGEGGYPGNLKAEVTYTFDDKDRLRVDYKAKTDKDTVLNMTNHAYFNLDGTDNTDKNSVYEHIVQLPNSSKFTPIGEYALPTGEVASVKNTPMDLRIPKKIGDVINTDYEQLKLVSGFDHNYCIDGYNGKDIIQAAKIKSEKTGISMKVSTNLPGFQFYTANHLGKNTQPTGREGKIYEKRSSFCIEPQFYPDAMAKFSEKPILKKNEEYNRTIIYEFSNLDD